MIIAKPGTLSTRTLPQVIGAVTLILAATAGCAYLAVLKAMERQSLEALSGYAGERARRENVMFALAEHNLAMLRPRFAERWGEPDPEDPGHWFDQRHLAPPEGTVRSIRAKVNPAVHASTWIRTRPAPTAEIKWLVTITSELCELYHPARAANFRALYASSPLDFNTGITPDEPDWVRETDARFDQTASEWGRVLPAPELRHQAFLSTRRVLWSGIGALALALGILWWIMRRQIALPLDQFLEMTRRVSAGDTGARVDWRGNDELGRMAAAFNQMAHNIAERDARLQRLNQELEARIADRTEGLRQSEERFSRAFHGSHALLAILDATDGRFLDVNESFLRTFGYTRDEVLGKRQSELECWRDPGQSDALILAYGETGYARDVETPMRSRHGEDRIIIQSGDRVRIGTADCILTVATDITERKRAEAEMRKALERERELNELKNNFVAMISHEFRTPLEVITTSTDILGRYFERVSAEQRAHQISTIQGAVKRMVSMMEEVLLLGRAEAGKLHFHPEDLHLTQWCRRLVEEIGAASALPRDLRLEMDDFPPMVMADESLLRHILTNLLSNALKYSDNGQPVVFRVRRESEEAVFIVRDQGLGIPESDRPHLFGEFHRGSNVGQRPGTGLGLVIAKRCVELHGGTVSFSSVTGFGTTFIVKLPLFPISP